MRCRCHKEISLWSDGVGALTRLAGWTLTTLSCAIVWFPKFSFFKRPMSFSSVRFAALPFASLSTDALRAQLTDQEIAQCADYASGERHKHLCGRLLCRQIVSEATGCPLGEAPVAHDGDRGPTILGTSNLCLSLSYSGTRAVAAIANGPIGVDAETIRHLDDLDTLIAETCHCSEQAVLNGLDPTDRLRKFYEFWTGKEAFLKGLGAGLSIAPERISLSEHPGCVFLDGCKTRWSVYLMGEIGGEVVSLAKL